MSGWFGGVRSDWAQAYLFMFDYATEQLIIISPWVWGSGSWIEKGEGSGGGPAEHDRLDRLLLSGLHVLLQICLSSLFRVEVVHQYLGLLQSLSHLRSVTYRAYTCFHVVDLTQGFALLREHHGFACLLQLFAGKLRDAGKFSRFHHGEARIRQFQGRLKDVF